PFTVAGILPAELRVPERGQLTAKIDAFVPMRIAAGWFGDHNNDAIGLLRPGVSIERARAELGVLQNQVSELATNAAHEKVTLTPSVEPAAEVIAGKSRQGLLLLFGAIGGVLLI